MTDYAFGTTLAKHIGDLKKLNGVARDYVLRYFIDNDQFWFNDKNLEHPFKLNRMHPWAKPVIDPATGKNIEYQVNDWRDRVMNLCEYKFTHECFGLGYNDLMHLDPATFEEIEERVYNLVKEQTESVNKSFEHQMGKPGGNFLKEGRK